MNISNPGLPVALSNLASVGVYITAAMLARWMPSYFDQVKTDPWTFVGVIMIVVGASIISLR